MKDAPMRNPSFIVTVCLSLASLLLMAGALVGCHSSKSGGSGGAGGQAETGGVAASASADAGGLGGAGAGGTSSSGGTTGSGSGGSGTGGKAGGLGTGGVGTGGISGTAAGGTSAGGAGTGGISGTAAGGTSAGGAGTGGIDAGGATGVDAGCAGGACAQDAASGQDVPPACSQIRTQAACDQRSDCHSLNINAKSCGCTTPGCCASFDRCENGGTVACSGQVSCTQATPYCEAPFTVQYQNDCFYGCVLGSKCAPTATCPLAPPANGSSCGGTALSCVYQDCAGAGRTQASCQGGTWSVQTVSCDSVSCKGGGVSPSAAVICGPGQICVHTTSSGGAYVITPSCATNTCGASAVSLSCIQGLSGNCSVVSDSEVSCSLQTCTSSTSCPP